jgi:hypothetical protein
VNVDETSWMLFPTGFLKWAEVGSEDVTVHVRGQLKECVTVLATITAGLQKLPLVILTAGRTEMVEATQLGNVGWHFTDHSRSLGQRRKHSVGISAGSVWRTTRTTNPYIWFSTPTPPTGRSTSEIGMQETRRSVLCRPIGGRCGGLAENLG